MEAALSGWNLVLITVAVVGACWLIPLLWRKREREAAAFVESLKASAMMTDEFGRDSTGQPAPSRGARHGGFADDPSRGKEVLKRLLDCSIHYQMKALADELPELRSEGFLRSLSRYIARLRPDQKDMSAFLFYQLLW